MTILSLRNLLRIGPQADACGSLQGPQLCCERTLIFVFQFLGYQGPVDERRLHVRGEGVKTGSTHFLSAPPLFPRVTRASGFQLQDLLLMFLVVSSSKKIFL